MAVNEATIHDAPVREGGSARGPVVLVTGSNSGFGRLTVETLARRGHTVVAGMRASAGRNADAATALRDLAREGGHTLSVVDLDVTDDRSVEQAVAAAVAAWGRIDVVVNNAGVFYGGPIESFTVEQARALFEINVFGVLRVNRAVLPHMRDQGSGLLVQVGSVIGRLALPYVGFYGATKFALDGLTEAYRYELAPLGIDAAIVEPGTYPTPIGGKSTSPQDGARVAPYGQAMGAFFEHFFADMTATPPDPQEVAAAIVALIEAPAGTRPLRTVTALPRQAAPTRELDEAGARVARDFIADLGLTDAFTLAATSIRA